MNTYIESVNSGLFYLLVALVLTFITIMCVIFLVKSYKAGIAMGMDPKVLKKTITASATFTLLPSISILLGVIALSGTLGVPFSWLRLSVIGSLQYELNVAEIAAQSAGLTGLNLAQLDMNVFVTIALVMTVGILGGIMCCIFFLKKYMNKLQTKPKKESSGKPGFGAHATTATYVPKRSPNWDSPYVPSPGRCPKLPPHRHHLPARACGFAPGQEFFCR